MRSDRLGASFAACAFVFATGCTLLVSLDGLSGGNAASGSDGSDDASTTGDSATNRDAFTTAETGVPIPDAGMGDARFCAQASAAALCDDFDDVDASVQGPRDQSDVASGGSLSVAGTRWVSPPHSLHLQSTSTATTIALGREVTKLEGATLTFDVYLEARGSNLSMAWIEATSETALYIQAQSETYAQLTEHFVSNGTSVYQSSPGAAIPIGAWVHVVLDVDLPQRLAILTVGGAELARRTLAPVWGTLTQLGVFLGVSSTANASLYYDNVTIETR